jgi:hypothetical protein
VLSTREETFFINETACLLRKKPKLPNKAASETNCKQFTSHQV